MVRTDVSIRDSVVTALEHRSPGEGHALDAAGSAVLPGFIDIHVHGGGGHSFFTRDPARIEAYAQWAPRNGVTSFLVSLVGNDAEDTCVMLAALKPALTGSNYAAQPLGFHLEGPFINPVRKGAFPEPVLRAPVAEEFVRYQDAAGGAIRQMTVAPELPGAHDVADAAVGSGCRAAMGHTDASFEEARRGLAGPFSHVTHLFNAMRPLHQRDGGPIAAALLSDATCELIFDGVHVSSEVLRLAYRNLGPNRTIVVTDNLYLAGTDVAEGTFAGGTVRSGAGVARRGDGTIVGSTMTLDDHFRNATRFLNVDLATASQLCSTNAARLLGMQDRGVIGVGAVADFVLLDEALEVVATVCRGRLAYLRPRDEWRHSA